MLNNSERNDFASWKFQGQYFDFFFFFCYKSYGNTLINENDKKNL